MQRLQRYTVHNLYVFVQDADIPEPASLTRLDWRVAK